MPSKFERWRALAPGERWLLVRLALLLPAVGGVLRLFGIGRTYRLLNRTAGHVTEVADGDAYAGAVRVGRLVQIASRHGPYHATCLRQSLALWWVLRRRGLPAHLRLGVGKREADLEAHAWVELDGRAVNDRPTIAQDYAPYEGLERGLLRS